MKAMFDSMIVWKLAIARAANKVFIAGATAFCASMSGLEWSVFTTSQKVILILSVIVVMGNTLDAFLDKTISNITAGKPPVGGTETFEKIKLQ